MNADELGYDPHADLTRWHNTPIPPVCRPLTYTPNRWLVADHIWWFGPPWSVLRNADYFIWQLLDYGADAWISMMFNEIPKDVFRTALRHASPGRLSRGSWLGYSLGLGLITDVDSYRAALARDWPMEGHRNDLHQIYLRKKTASRERRICGIN